MTKEEKSLKAKQYYINNKERIALKTKEYQKKNKEKILKRRKIYRQTESGKLSTKKSKIKYYSKNKELLNLKSKIYREDNLEELRIKQRVAKRIAYPKHKDQIKANVKIRKALKKQRVPLWANLAYIRDIYKNCPEGYHVDHIIPLQGELVSGLHVEYNLLYLTAKENIAKSNIFPHLEYHIV